MKQKMKHLQSLVAVALCVIFAMSFSSCSKDDDEPEKPKVEKRMMSIDKKSFEYTNGKITQILWSGSVDYNITYTETSIKTDFETFYLDNGLVTKYVESGGDYYHEFSYEDGRLKSWKKYYEDGIDEDITFEWKDGVITRQTGLDSEGGILFDFHYTYTKDYDYGGAVAGLQSDYFFYDDLPEALIIQGYFGKWPKYLVAQINDSNPDRFGLNTFSYILDDDGYPLSLIWTLKDGRSFPAKFTWVNVK